MTFIYKLDRYLSRYTGFAKMNFLRQGFRKLSSDRHTYRHDRNYNKLPRRFVGARNNFRSISFISALTVYSSFTPAASRLAGSWLQLAIIARPAQERKTIRRLVFRALSRVRSQSATGLQYDLSVLSCDRLFMSLLRERHKIILITSVMHLDSVISRILSTYTRTFYTAA